jgi:hypothetical protein
MPTLWLGSDSPGATPQGNSPLQISFADLNVVFGDRAVRFIGEARPALAQHVLVEIAQDELRPPLFTRPGYYRVENTSPEAAREVLRKHGVAGA